MCFWRDDDDDDVGVNLGVIDVVSRPEGVTVSLPVTSCFTNSSVSCSVWEKIVFTYCYIRYFIGIIFDSSVSFSVWAKIVFTVTLDILNSFHLVVF